MGVSVRLAGAAAAVALFITTSVLSVFVPLRQDDRVDYLFAWPGERLVGWTIAFSAIGVVLLYVAVVLAATRGSADRVAQARGARWLSPISWCAVLALGISAAVPHVGVIAAPAAYLLYDLRWWWLAIIAWRLAANIDRLLGGRVASLFAHPRRWTPRTRVFALDIAVCLAAMAWAVATTPVLRFTGILHGDEPKYLRLCETLYQGRGLEIGHKPMMDERPLDAPSRVTNNITLFIQAATDDTRTFAADLREFATHPTTFRWNRAVAQPNWFLTGKSGSLYEVHQPGLSLLLFPGYYIDRHFLSVAPGYQHEFPAELFLTTGTLLLLYGLCGVALFRLLRYVMALDGWAAMVALVGVITLPTTAFPFQIYPEIPAALILLVVTTVLLFHREAARPLVAGLAGAATSYLLWLHPRFLLLVMVLAAIAWINLRGVARRRFFVAACIVGLAWCAVAYHITGSWLPTALYDSDRESHAFLLSIVPVNLVANVVDRTWGLLPHSVLLLAVPAGLLLVWRQRRSDAVALVAIGFALAITTAAHGLSASGATPGRHMLAVMPLAMWPFALLVDRVRRQPVPAAVLFVLVLVSLESALAYNWVHIKEIGRMVATNASGWQPNLMFPAPRGDSGRSVVAIIGQWLALGGVVIAGSVWWLRPRGVARGSMMSALPPVAAAAVVIATVLTAAGPSWVSGDYVPTRSQAEWVAAPHLVSLDRCRVCFTSSRGGFDWTALGPNDVHDLKVAADANGDRLATFEITLVRNEPLTEERDMPAFGRVRIEFGDGQVSPWIGVVESGRVRHQYGPGEIGRTMVTLQLPDGSQKFARGDGLQFR